MQRLKGLTFTSATQLGLSSFVDFGPPVYYSRPEETGCKLLVTRLIALPPPQETEGILTGFPTMGPGVSFKRRREEVKSKH